MTHQDLITLIETGAQKLKVTLTQEALVKLARLVELVIETNEQVNITGITEPEAIVQKHILDSLSCIAVFPEDAQSLIDIGSGAGFPALPLAIALPNLRVCAVESVGKKAAVITHFAEVLELENVEVVCTRAEEIGHHQDYRELFDIAIARAVTRLPTLCEYLLPLVEVGGMMIAQKGAATANDELEQARFAISELGGNSKATAVIASTLSGDVEPRVFICIPKMSATYKKYPREVGTPQKLPLIN